jgi:hypothetical protein
MSLVPLGSTLKTFQKMKEIKTKFETEKENFELILGFLQKGLTAP